jgi:hypothetical protein
MSAGKVIPFSARPPISHIMAGGLLIERLATKQIDGSDQSKLTTDVLHTAQNYYSKKTQSTRCMPQPKAIEPAKFHLQTMSMLL